MGYRTGMGVTAPPSAAVVLWGRKVSQPFYRQRRKNIKRKVTAHLLLKMC